MKISEVSGERVDHEAKLKVISQEEEAIKAEKEEAKKTEEEEKRITEEAKQKEEEERRLAEEVIVSVYKEKVQYLMRHTCAISCLHGL